MIHPLFTVYAQGRHLHVPKYLAAGAWSEAFEMPRKAIWRLYNARKRLAAGAAPRAPLGSLYSSLRPGRPPRWWGRD